MKIAVTGHRPPKAGLDWDGEGPVSSYVYSSLRDKVRDIEEENITLISGMALGVDQIFANLAIHLDLPLIAAIPCRNHSCKWPQKSREKYEEILRYNKCEEVLLSDVDYAPWVMQKRNEWMVDNCDLLIAVHIPDEPGGTMNCIKYAEKVGKPIYRINPNVEIN